MTSRTPGAVGWGGAAWWGIGGVLLALFVAGNAARYVPPETLWPLQLLGIAVPSLGVLLVLEGLAALLVRRWWLASVFFSAVVVAVALARAPAPARASHRTATSEASLRPAGTAPPGNAPLRVMTFNASPSQSRLDEAEVLALLDREEPHLVALQEFPAHLDRSTSIRSGPPFLIPFLEGNRFGISWPAGRGDVLMGRPILSQLDPAGPVEIVPGKPDRGIQEGLWASGGITRGTYRWQGQTIAVYNVHLHSFGRDRPWKEGGRSVLSIKAWGEALRTYRGDFITRAQQARILRRMLDEEGYPFIVCGDFNSTPHNWVYDHLARGLQDAFRKAGSGWGGTYHARFPLIRIDFVLASQEWEIRGAHVDKTIASDHFPVIAELVLRSPPAPE